MNTLKLSFLKNKQKTWKPLQDLLLTVKPLCLEKISKRHFLTNFTIETKKVILVTLVTTHFFIIIYSHLQYLVINH